VHCIQQLKWVRQHCLHATTTIAAKGRLCSLLLCVMCRKVALLLFICFPELCCTLAHHSIGPARNNSCRDYRLHHGSGCCRAAIDTAYRWRWSQDPTLVQQP
jgi:hypothetical protein